MPNEVIYLEIYKDAGLKERLNHFDIGECEAGFETIKTFWIKNVTDYIICNLEFNFESKEFKVIKVPDKINPDEAGEVQILVKPSIRIKEPLKSNCQMRMDGKSPVGIKLKLEVPHKKLPMIKDIKEARELLGV